MFWDAPHACGGQLQPPQPEEQLHQLHQLQQLQQQQQAQYQQLQQLRLQQPLLQPQLQNQQAPPRLQLLSHVRPPQQQPPVQGVSEAPSALTQLLLEKDQAEALEQAKEARRTRLAEQNLALQSRGQEQQLQQMQLQTQQQQLQQAQQLQAQQLQQLQHYHHESVREAWQRGDHQQLQLAQGTQQLQLQQAQQAQLQLQQQLQEVQRQQQSLQNAQQDLQREYQALQMEMQKEAQEEERAAAAARQQLLQQQQQLRAAAAGPGPYAGAGNGQWWSPGTVASASSAAGGCHGAATPAVVVPQVRPPLSLQRAYAGYSASTPALGAAASGIAAGAWKPQPQIVIAPPKAARPELTAQQRSIRDGDFQVQRTAGMQAAEQVQEALDLCSSSQLELVKLGNEVEVLLEKATTAQDYQFRARQGSNVASFTLEYQQQQVAMLQQANAWLNEASGLADRLFASIEEAVEGVRKAAQKVQSATPPLMALARKPEHQARAEKAEQQALQAERAARGVSPGLQAARAELDAAVESRDASGLVSACRALKATVAQAAHSAGVAFQATQLAQHAAPAVQTRGSGGGSSSSTTPATGPPPLPGPPRETLPIDEHRDEIVKAIRGQRVVCIQGETGCGKSSRVPQYVHYLCRERPSDLKHFEDFRIIICTQPRRLAAITLAQRVANEMGESTVGGLVGYKISGDAAFEARRTRLLFVTTGYLLQVLVSDPTHIRRFSHIILDEAHERSVDADLVCLVLKLMLQHQMADFKVIIMSATLQGGIFSRYFSDEGDTREPPAPIFVGVKRYPLDILYLDDLSSLSSRFAKSDLALTTLDQLRQNTENSLSEAGLAAVRAGVDTFSKAVLMAQRKTNASGMAAAQACTLAQLASVELAGETSESEFWRINAASSGDGPPAAGGRPRGGAFVKPQLQKGFESVVLELVKVLGTGGEGILVFLPGIGEISEVFDVLACLENSNVEAAEPGSIAWKLQQNRKAPVCEYKIFVLHSTIPMDEQEQAFHQPPANVCHVFLASTIAESSVTLPKVRIVIDTCLRRQLAHDRTRHGMSCLATQWVSHASASQRSGRAGRVFPGVSIRLVPRSFYTCVMPQYDPPEIEQAPLEKLYLHVKQLSHRLREKLPRIGALPPRRLLQMTVQPPPSENIEEAVETLWELGALTSRSDATAQITVLGCLAIALPLELRLCRLVLFGVLFGCAADAIVMATALGGQDPFTMPLSMVIKDHQKFVRGLLRSSECRTSVDAGALSEPVMLRNLFMEWLRGLSLEEVSGKVAAQNAGGAAGSAQRHVFVKHSSAFQQSHAVMPKRLTQMALTVADVTQRTLEFLETNSRSPARQCLEGLLARLGVSPLQPRRATAAGEAAAAAMSAPPRVEAVAVLPRTLEEIFSQDLMLLVTTVVAAFSPLYAHGMLRCVEHKTKLEGPLTLVAEPPASAAGAGASLACNVAAEDRGDGLRGSGDGCEVVKVLRPAPPVVIPADPFLARIHSLMLREADAIGGPRFAFCIPNVCETLLQQPDLLSLSLKEFVSTGQATFKKIHMIQGQAFVSFDPLKKKIDSCPDQADESDGSSGASEQEEVVLTLEALAREAAKQEREAEEAAKRKAEAEEEDRNSGPVRQRAVSSDSSSSFRQRRRKKQRRKKSSSSDASSASDNSVKRREMAAIRAGAGLAVLASRPRRQTRTEEDPEDRKDDQDVAAQAKHKTKIKIKWAKDKDKESRPIGDQETEKRREDVAGSEDEFGDKRKACADGGDEEREPAEAHDAAEPRDEDSLRLGEEPLSAAGAAANAAAALSAACAVVTASAGGGGSRRKDTNQPTVEAVFEAVAPATGGGSVKISLRLGGDQDSAEGSVLGMLKEKQLEEAQRLQRVEEERRRKKSKKAAEERPPKKAKHMEADEEEEESDDEMESRRADGEGPLELAPTSSGEPNASVGIVASEVKETLNESEENEEVGGVGLKRGVVVLIRGLKAGKDLNGKHGVVERFDTATGSWHVRLGPNKVKVLRAEHLEVIAKDSIESTASLTASDGTLPEGMAAICSQRDRSRSRDDPPGIGGEASARLAAKAEAASFADVEEKLVSKKRRTDAADVHFDEFLKELNEIEGAGTGDSSEANDDDEKRRKKEAVDAEAEVAALRLEIQGLLEAKDKRKERVKDKAKDSGKERGIKDKGKERRVKDSGKGEKDKKDREREKDASSQGRTRDKDRKRGRANERSSSSSSLHEDRNWKRDQKSITQENDQALGDVAPPSPRAPPAAPNRRARNCFAIGMAAQEAAQDDEELGETRKQTVKKQRVGGASAVVERHEIEEQKELGETCKQPEHDGIVAVVEEETERTHAEEKREREDPEAFKVGDSAEVIFDKNVSDRVEDDAKVLDENEHEKDQQSSAKEDDATVIAEMDMLEKDAHKDDKEDDSNIIANRGEFEKDEQKDKTEDSDAKDQREKEDSDEKDEREHEEGKDSDEKDDREQEEEQAEGAKDSAEKEEREHEEEKGVAEDSDEKDEREHEEEKAEDAKDSDEKDEPEHEEEKGVAEAEDAKDSDEKDECEQEEKDVAEEEDAKDSDEKDEPEREEEKGVAEAHDAKDSVEKDKREQEEKDVAEDSDEKDEGDKQDDKDAEEVHLEDTKDEDAEKKSDPKEAPDVDETKEEAENKSKASDGKEDIKNDDADAVEPSDSEGSQDKKRKAAEIKTNAENHEIGDGPKNEEERDASKEKEAESDNDKMQGTTSDSGAMHKAKDAQKETEKGTDVKPTTEKEVEMEYGTEPKEEAPPPPPPPPDDDFLAFLNEVNSIEDQPQAPDDEEHDSARDLARLPIVELKRRLRAAGIAVPPECQDAEELVTLLCMNTGDSAGQHGASVGLEAQSASPPPPPSDDEKVEAPPPEGSPPPEPGASDWEVKMASVGEAAVSGSDKAFMDFLIEIDQIPADPQVAETVEEVVALEPALVAADVAEDQTIAVAEEAPAATSDGDSVEPPTASAAQQQQQQQPFSLSFAEDQWAWIVTLGHGLGSRRFPAALDPLLARRRALQYCQAKFRALESGELRSAEADEESDLQEKLRRRAEFGEMILESPPRVCRGVPFRALHLLHQLGGGKATFAWPLPAKLQQKGLQGLRDAMLEADLRVELHRPVHPFQLHWRVCLERGDGAGGGEAKCSFGSGNFRNPTGLVLSCPSARTIEKLQNRQGQQDRDQAAMIQSIRERHQQALSHALALAQSPQEALLARQRLDAEAQASLLAVGSELTDGRWARRLERFAVFCGAQGREEGRSGTMQLEGLTVVPHGREGSNVFPVLLMLAFIRPFLCGGSVPGGCSVLCDLDDMRVRAVSIFGHSPEARWMLPVTGKRKLTLEDLQRVNNLRGSISAAIEAMDEEAVAASSSDADAFAFLAPPADSQQPQQSQQGKPIEDRGRPVIRESPLLSRALAELLADVGGDAPSPFGKKDDSSAVVSAEKAAGDDEADAAARSRGRRAYGDHWIDIEEDLPGVGDSQAGFVRWDADVVRHSGLGAGARRGVAPPTLDLGSGGGGSSGSRASGLPSASATFFAFDAPVEAFSSVAERGVEGNQSSVVADGAHLCTGGDADSSANKYAAAGGRRGPGVDDTGGEEEPSGCPVRFTFLPPLKLVTAIEDKAARLKQMMLEASELERQSLSSSEDVELRVKRMRDLARVVDAAMETSRHAYGMAMAANSAEQADEAMQQALATIRDVQNAMAELSSTIGLVEDAHNSAAERERRAAEGHAQVSHFWALALKAARAAQSKLAGQRRSAFSTMQRAEVSRRTTMLKADDVVRLVNEKMQRWADERQILIEEANYLERQRQEELRQQQYALLMAQREAQLELDRRRMELERQALDAAKRRQESIQWGRHLVTPNPTIQFAFQPPGTPGAAPQLLGAGPQQPQPQQHQPQQQQHWQQSQPQQQWQQPQQQWQQQQQQGVGQQQLGDAVPRPPWAQGGGPPPPWARATAPPPPLKAFGGLGSQSAPIDVDDAPPPPPDDECWPPPPPPQQQLHQQLHQPQQQHQLQPQQSHLGGYAGAHGGQWGRR